MVLLQILQPKVRSLQHLAEEFAQLMKAQFLIVKPNLLKLAISQCLFVSMVKNLEGYVELTGVRLLVALPKANSEQYNTVVDFAAKTTELFLTAIQI